MASSSKSASTSASASASAGDGNTYYPYEVFLNHRGADGKKFASDLYNRLTDLGLEVFLDTEEMEKGERLTDQLKGAITAASVNIAIFSPRYCESCWCLDELLLMLECCKLKKRSTILPIFLHVTPSVVRWATDEYAKALKLLEEKKTSDQPRHGAEIIRKWKDALHAVADLSGFELDKEPYNGDETKLLTDVVNKVRKLVPKKLSVSQYPLAGLGDKLEDFEEKLRQHETRKAKVVGIVGLGGIGKTTLAKKCYNRNQKDYHRSSFVSDVRETYAGKLIKNLQGKLIKDLSQKNRDRDIDSTDECIPFLEKLLPHYHALILLDDVDSKKQLDALLPVLPAKDSLILVTCRDKKVLEGWKFFEDTFIYTLEGLSQQHSVELFCCCDFNQLAPLKGFEELVQNFVHACGGVPLFLEVFGTLVRDEKKPEHWKEHLHKLSKIPPTEIENKLEISYKSLDDQEKMIFLDVARFFVGKEKDTAMRIWEASGWQASIGLQSLEKKHLVEVKEQTVWKEDIGFQRYSECMVDCITMHDVLRGMGISLACKKPSRCRIWTVTKNLSEVQSDVGRIKNSAERNSEVADLRWRKKSSCVESVFNVEQPPQLILLRCYDCPDSSFPPNISIKNLGVLHIEGSNLETLWQLESQAPRELRELYIGGSLRKIPESIGQLRLLEKVVLRSEGDDKLMSFETLPDEFCELQSLKHLELHQECLKSLPESFGDLSSLQHVNLAMCKCLEMLPGSFVNLSKLQHLNLSYCQELQLLPDSFGNLTNLQHLDLSGCHNLEKLPDSFGNLTTLQHLDLSACYNLETLPNNFGNLRQLKFLSLQDCASLTIPSEALGNITTLEYLDLQGCEEFPTQLSFQPDLQKLYVSSAELPSWFGDLTSLEVLGFNECPFNGFPDSIINLTQLKFLSLKNMDRQQIKITEWLSGLPTTLETLEIYDCDGIMEELTVFERLESLEDLQITGCRGLKRIHGLAQLTNLQKLDVQMCSELVELPGIEGSQSLKEVNFSGCSKLKQENVSYIESLELRQYES